MWEENLQLKTLKSKLLLLPKEPGRSFSNVYEECTGLGYFQRSDWSQCLVKKFGSPSVVLDFSVTVYR